VASRGHGRLDLHAIHKPDACATATDKPATKRSLVVAKRPRGCHDEHDKSFRAG
jgi:hypothetical protein